MFCVNCGKKLKEGTAFCVHCGYRQEEEKKELNFFEKVVRRETRKELPKILKSITMFDIGIIGFYVVTFFKWLITFITNFQYVWDTVKYSNSGISFIFIVFYIMLFLILAVICGGGIWFTVKKKYHILVSLILAVVGVVLKIGALLSRFIPWHSFLYAGGVVITIYGSIGLYVLVMGLLSAIFLYAKNTSSI